MGNDSYGWLPDFAQALGVELSDVTLLGVWMFSYGLARRLLGSGPRHDRGRQDLARLAVTFNDRLTAFYRNGVNLMLSQVDRGAGDRFLDRAESGHSGNPHPFRDPSPWSSGVYDLTLRLAFAYPILFFFAGWVWGGRSAPGLEIFLASEPEVWRRGLAFAGLAMAMFLLVRSRREKSWRRLAYISAAISVAAAVAGPVAAVVAFAAGSAFALAIVGVGAVVVAAAVAGAVGVSVALAVVDAVAVAVTVVSATAIGVSVVFAVTYVERRAGGGRVKTLFYILHWLVFSGIAMAAFHFQPHLESVPVATALLLIVFFALLPLANAPLDWLSLGLTRGLLHYGLAIGGTWRIAAVSLVDIVLAVALMFPLAAITTAVIGLANWSAVSAGGGPVLPVVPMLDSLRNAPDDPKFYWIYLMLFSTLVPSLIHILCGLVGLALACLQPVFRAAVLAQDFAKDKSVEDVTKQTKLRYWYPALAASGATLLAAVIYLIGTAVPHVRAAAIYFAELLLATAEWVASFFPA